MLAFKIPNSLTEIVCLSDSTVEGIISCFVHENRVRDNGREAANKIFNAADELNKNTKLSATELDG